VTGAYWCELAWLGGEEPQAGVLIETEGERIASVAAGIAATDGVARLEGLTMPGLANVHSHAFQRALRGRTHRALGGSFWSWREQMYALAEGLDDDAVYEISRATYEEMLRGGITLVGEFDYLHRSDAILSAAADAGIRATLIDACYLTGGLERFHDANAGAWTDRVAAISPGPAARLGAAIHSVRAVDPDSAAIVAAFVNERRWPLHAHVSEQPAENEECRARFGMTPLQVLAGAGAVSERFTAIHATHFTDDDALTLGAAGAFCCLCPTTERDLADGIGRPYGRLTLGSDSQAVIDLFEEARAVELDLRLATLVRGHLRAADLAVAATANGYSSLGWPEGGRIEAGALADLVTVGLDGSRLTGTRPQDALDAVIFAGARDDIRHVIVGGRELKLG
jgi:formiminoglutamate deiminase